MEKKSLLLIGVVMALVTSGALALLFVVMKPAGIKEAEQAGDGAFRFPDKTAGRPLPNSLPPPVSPSSMPGAPPPAEGTSEQASAPKSGDSSLGFITKDPAGTKRPVDGSSAEPPAEAADAAARGDAAGIASSLKRAKGSEAPAVSSKADSFTRGVLQTVVDLVHDEQPEWYDEFLAKKELKKIADDYDKSNDFAMFVVQLAESPFFNKMLAAKQGKADMKALVGKIFGKKKLAKDLRRIIEDNINDGNLLVMIRKYGRKCFLPKDITEKAEAAAPEEGARGEAPPEEAAPAPPAKKPAPARKAFNKPKLNPTGGFSFGGAGGSRPSMQMNQGQTQGQVDPNNVDVEALKKQYLNKKP